MDSWLPLLQGVREGKPRALARFITRVENRNEGWLEALRRLHPDTGRAHTIGITGSPGSGKSTLTGQLAQHLAEQGARVGVIAVDPSSPFSGGAILGDRVRMAEAGRHERVFLRSMATRGALGGLCYAARDVVKIMDAAGMDFILIETVGVGQDEIEVIRAADVVLVVCVPGQGDGVQAIKAGVMEIADIFVVNKADRDGADQVVAQLEAMLDLDPNGPRPPVLRSTATTGDGVEKVLATTRTLLEHPLRGDEWQRARQREEIEGLIHEGVVARLRRHWAGDRSFAEALAAVHDGSSDPYRVVQEVLQALDTYLTPVPRAQGDAP